MPLRAPADDEAISLQRLKAIIVGSIGNLVEWYDFYAYSAFALYFASSFFPKEDPTAQMLSTAGIFALGFFIRPVGGLLFGYIGDHLGRRTALMASVLLMCGGSLLIACAPTYGSVGALAPALLLLARLLQGLSLGGEYGSSATYLSEMASSKHRGFYASFQYVTLIGGQLTALLLLLVLQHLVLTPEQLKAWGWRIPFFVGALLALTALWMRRDLPETRSFEQAKTQGKKMGGLRQLLQYPRECTIVIGLTMGGTLAFYVYTTYMQKYLVNTAGMHAKTASYIMTGALFLYMCMQPLFGMLADKIGRRNSMLWFGALGTLFTVPILLSLKTVSSPFLAFVLITLALAIVSFYTSISGLVKAEMFPPQVRALGVGLAYAVANAIFGGSAEYVALGLKSLGMENTFYWYVTGMMAVAFLFSLRLPKQAAYLHHDL